MLVAQPEKECPPHGLQEVALVVTEPNGIVRKRFRANVLVGAIDNGGEPAFAALVPNAGKWGATWWFVFRGARGKLAVYKMYLDRTGGELHMFDSFAEMQGIVPDDVIESARAQEDPTRLGIEYPEERIDLYAGGPSARRGIVAVCGGYPRWAVLHEADVLPAQTRTNRRFQASPRRHGAEAQNFG